MKRMANLSHSLTLVILLGTTSSLAGALVAALMFITVAGAYGFAWHRCEGTPRGQVHCWRVCCSRPR